MHISKTMNYNYSIFLIIKMLSIVKLDPQCCPTLLLKFLIWTNLNLNYLRLLLLMYSFSPKDTQVSDFLWLSLWFQISLWLYLKSIQNALNTVKKMYRLFYLIKMTIIIICFTSMLKIFCCTFFKRNLCTHTYFYSITV